MLQLNKGEYTGEIISNINIDGSILTTTHYSNKKSNSNWHYHENLHICFVFQGGRADKRNDTLYTEKSVSIFFYHSEEKHRWISPNPISKSANIEINNTFLKEYNLSEFDIKKSIEGNVDAKALILKMQQEMLFNDATSRASIKSLLLELVNHSSKPQSEYIPQWVINLEELIHENWNQPMSLSNLATNIGVHPVTISKYFRKYFSCTLGEYQRKLKIDKSIELIKNTSMTLTEIAFHCGFTDQSHFIRNFKQMTGFLPKHFRKF